MELPNDLKPIVGFATRALVAAGCFVAVLAVTIVLGLIMKGLEYLGLAPEAVRMTAPYVEDALYGADLFGLALLVVVEVLRFARGLWREWKQG